MSTHNMFLCRTGENYPKITTKILLLNNSSAFSIKQEEMIYKNSVNSDRHEQVEKNVESDQGLQYLPLVWQFLDSATGSKTELFSY